MEGQVAGSTVLIVDDEEDVHYSFRRFLAPLQCRILNAMSGEDALEVLKTEAPDLIIMDIKMSGMDGLATLREISRTHHRMPVIIMTAYSTTTSAIEATRLGAFDYVMKPFDPPKMMEVIQQALSTRRMMQNRWYGGQRKDYPVEKTYSLELLPCRKCINSSARWRTVMHWCSSRERVVPVGWLPGDLQSQPAEREYFSAHKLRRDPGDTLESGCSGHEKGPFRSDQRRITSLSRRRMGRFFWMKLVS